jgi:hypothetical protein
MRGKKVGLYFPSNLLLLWAICGKVEKIYDENIKYREKESYKIVFKVY